MTKANISVLLKQDIGKLGKRGELVKVKPGYARNYLIPQDIACFATPGVLKQADRIFKAEQEKHLLEKTTLQNTQLLLEKIKKLTIKKKVGKGNAIFGTVTDKEIASKISQMTNEMIDKRQILCPDIKSIGQYYIEVKLKYNLVIKLDLSVIPTVLQ